MNPKWRTIPKALEEIKKTDPETALTDYALRKLQKDGTIPSIRVGRNVFIDITEIGGSDEKNN